MTVELRIFTYGSNMLGERLADRCPGARPIGAAVAGGYTLSFHKRSIDGSGKGMLVPADPAILLPGVLFAIDDAERDALDVAEGVGTGYTREEGFEVTLTATGETVAATVYQVQASHIDTALAPYEWYRALVLAGAHQNGLPPEWIERLTAQPFIMDPKPDRKTRLDAIRVLEQAGYAHLLPLPVA